MNARFGTLRRLAAALALAALVAAPVLAAPADDGPSAPDGGANVFAGLVHSVGGFLSALLGDPPRVVEHRDDKGPGSVHGPIGSGFDPNGVRPHHQPPPNSGSLSIH